jgi:hypothetical protein
MTALQLQLQRTPHCILGAKPHSCTQENIADRSTSDLPQSLHYREARAVNSLLCRANEMYTTHLCILHAYACLTHRSHTAGRAAGAVHASARHMAAASAAPYASKNCDTRTAFRSCRSTDNTSSGLQPREKQPSNSMIIIMIHVELKGGRHVKRLT